MFTLLLKRSERRGRVAICTLTLPLLLDDVDDKSQYGDQRGCTTDTQTKDAEDVVHTGTPRGSSMSDPTYMSQRTFPGLLVPSQAIKLDPMRSLVDHLKLDEGGGGKPASIAALHLESSTSRRIVFQVLAAKQGQVHLTYQLLIAVQQKILSARPSRQAQTDPCRYTEYEPQNCVKNDRRSAG